MFRYLSTVSFIILLFLPGLSGETVRVATLNLQNYLIMDRMVEGRWRPEYPKPEVEKAALRKAIRLADADILVLQEMGEAPFLKELQADLELEGLAYPYAYFAEANDAVRHVAVLSKQAAMEVIVHKDMDFKYFDSRELVKRGLFELSFKDSEGEIFKVFGVHLKSRWSDVKADPMSELRRTREAEACRDRMIERTYELGVDRFLVAGDFNDEPDSGVFRRFTKRGDLEISEFIRAKDSRGEVWTHFYAKKGAYTLVDGFFLSSDLMDALVIDSATIMDWDLGQAGSDHRLVYLDLDL
jgi:endonuclease/exonuclease/phosphatase family metal-dependent hydrolase